MSVRIVASEAFLVSVVQDGLIISRIKMNCNSYRHSHQDYGYGLKYENAYANNTYYFWLWQNVERKLLESALRECKAQGARSYLDFACGTGRILTLGAEVFSDSTGVDVSEPMLSIARSKVPQATLINQDITVTPLTEKFDLVTAFRFFRNAEESLRLEALNAIRNQLKPGGWFITNTHGNPRAPSIIALRLRAKLGGTSVRFLSHQRLSYLLEQNGFEVKKVINYSFLPRLGRFFPAWYQQSMLPYERLASRLPILQHSAESTLLVAKTV